MKKENLSVPDSPRLGEFDTREVRAREEARAARPSSWEMAAWAAVRGTTSRVAGMASAPFPLGFRIARAISSSLSHVVPAPLSAEACPLALSAARERAREGENVRMHRSVP